MRQRRKLLHVVHGMARGGVETWLLHVLRHMDRDRYEIDIATATPDPRPYDDEVRSLGCNIHYCAPLTSPAKYGRRLREILTANGPYDIVHSHLSFFTGNVLRAADLAGVPTRIAHIHNTRSGWSNDRPAVRMLRWGYRSLMRRWIRKHATSGLACSEDAADFLAGDRRAEPEFDVLLYGFDFSHFLANGDRADHKRKLGIPENARVVGHVGRFVTQKNHTFLVDVFAQAVRNGLDGHLLLLGAGPLQPSIREQIEASGLTDRCTFAGEHNNIAPYMGAMDLFFFPSLHEGLGIVAVEAQAAGLEVLASDEVPVEADVIEGRVSRLPLSAGVDRWAQELTARLASPALDPHATTPQVAAGSFGIARCVRELEAVYSGERLS